MVHGWIRIGTIWTMGVFVGGVVDLAVTPERALIGASGGCYALILAFTADIILNFDIMTTFGKMIRLAPISLYLVVDLGALIYRQVFSNEKDNISWAAHLGGN